MADLAIGAAISSLKTAGEMVGSFVKLRDEAMIQAKVIELQSVILAAQSSALAAQGEQFALLEAKRELEARIADLEAWERKKQRYDLKPLGRGGRAYTLKPDADPPEEPHHLCAACFNHGVPSVLMKEDRNPGRATYWACHTCGSDILESGVAVADHAKFRVVRRGR